MSKVGPFNINTVIQGDCKDLIKLLPKNCIDIVITSPPYWGQRISLGTGIEVDPRDYLKKIEEIFLLILPKLKDTGIVWINLGDAYNTPVNWRKNDRIYSSLGPDKNGLNENNSAYIKPRARRKPFVEKSTKWLKYGNLLALTYRLIIGLCDNGYLFRGEIIWHKKNPMPEGKCRRPHRQHESIYLLAKSEKHLFRTNPPVKSVWHFGNEKINGKAHFSRFPEELPKKCIESYGMIDKEVLVLDPYSGSGTTGIAALMLGCSYLGFEIDKEQVIASNERLKNIIKFNHHTVSLSQE